MRLVTIFGVIIAVALGLYMYSWQLQRMATATGAAGPQGIVDAVAVKADLLSIAGAERQQFALEGAYLPLDDLRGKGVKLPEKRGPYVFSADVTPTTFLIKATYQVPQGAKPMPTLTIGPEMEIKSVEETDR